MLRLQKLLEKKRSFDCYFVFKDATLSAVLLRQTRSWILTVTLSFMCCVKFYSFLAEICHMLCEVVTCKI